VEKDEGSRADIVRRNFEDLIRRESEILRRGLELIEKGVEQYDLPKEERIKLLESGPETLIFNCVLERGRMYADIVSFEIPLRIIAVTKDCQEAMQLYRSLKPDLIMTCHHGFPMIREVRAIDKKVPIVLVTWHDKLYKVAKEVGVNAFVPVIPTHEDLIAATKHAIVNREFAIFDSHNWIEKYAPE
jgi:hypothetical protein